MVKGGQLLCLSTAFTAPQSGFGFSRIEEPLQPRTVQSTARCVPNKPRSFARVGSGALGLSKFTHRPGFPLILRQRLQHATPDILATVPAISSIRASRKNRAPLPWERRTLPRASEGLDVCEPHLCRVQPHLCPVQRRAAPCERRFRRVRAAPWRLSAAPCPVRAAPYPVQAAPSGVRVHPCPV
jgi:hypothetical protein